MTVSTEITLFETVILGYVHLMQANERGLVDPALFTTVSNYCDLALQNADGERSGFLGEIDWFSRFTAGAARAWFESVLPYVKGMDDPADGKW